MAQNVLNVARLHELQKCVLAPKFDLVHQTVFFVRGWGLGIRLMEDLPVHHVVSLPLECSGRRLFFFIYSVLLEGRWRKLCLPCM